RIPYRSSPRRRELSVLTASSRLARRPRAKSSGAFFVMHVGREGSSNHNIHLAFFDHRYGKNTVKMWRRLQSTSKTLCSPGEYLLTIPVCVSLTRLAACG